MRNFLVKSIEVIFKNNSIKKTNSIGRWNLKDNSDIKATLANMDCCGDSYCGTPPNYKENINKILNEKK